MSIKFFKSVLQPLRIDLNKQHNKVLKNLSLKDQI